MSQQVIGWEEFFESAKSKTYKIKSQTYMPNKHGLGYKRLVSHDHGPAIFGAWCAMIQVLSRQPKERQGYLTDTGQPSGRPLSAEDIGLMTSMPTKLITTMLQVVSSESVGWLKDTTGILQEIVKNPKSVSDGEGECKGKGDGSEAFASFWQEWPAHSRKVNRKACLKAWMAHDLDSKAFVIMTSLDGWKKHADWLKESGQFIPAPLVWLNQERWEADLNSGTPMLWYDQINGRNMPAGYQPPNDPATGKPDPTVWKQVAQ